MHSCSPNAMPRATPGVPVGLAAAEIEDVGEAGLLAVAQGDADCEGLLEEEPLPSDTVPARVAVLWGEVEGVGRGDKEAFPVLVAGVVADARIEGVPPPVRVAPLRKLGVPGAAVPVAATTV